MILVPIITLLTAPVGRSVVIEGTGRALLSATSADTLPLGVARFVVQEPRAVKNLAIKAAQELKVRGAVQLTIRSGLTSGALIIAAGSSSVHLDAPAGDLTVRADESSEIDLTHCRLRKLRVVLTRSGSVRLSGAVDTLTVEGADAGWVWADSLDVKNANIKLTGSGSARLGEVDRLQTVTTSTGSVYAKSWSALVEHRTGIGRVQKS